MQCRYILLGFFLLSNAALFAPHVRNCAGFERGRPKFAGTLPLKIRGVQGQNPPIFRVVFQRQCDYTREYLRNETNHSRQTETILTTKGLLHSPQI